MLRQKLSRVASTVRKLARPLIARSFVRAYYEEGDGVDAGRAWKSTTWMGVPVRKLPMDLWLYQELIFKVRPDVIVECGTAFGGSALYFAHLLDLLGAGRVITVDIDDWDIELDGFAGRPDHPRITYMKGSSTDPAVVETVRSSIAEDASTMVILDSDHRAPHVLAELRAYSELVSAGSYLIVEDTMLNGHPVHPNFGPGPMEAVEGFLAEDSRFVSEPLEEKLLISFNPRGYLKRVR